MISLAYYYLEYLNQTQISTPSDNLITELNAANFLPCHKQLMSGFRMYPPVNVGTNDRVKKHRRPPNSKAGRLILQHIDFEHFIHILCHRKFSCSRIRFCRFDVIFHVVCSL